MNVLVSAAAVRRSHRLSPAPDAQTNVAPDRAVALAPPLGRDLDKADRALVALGQELRERGYRFTTVSPASHNRILLRNLERPATLTDIFGWSRCFDEDDLPARCLTYLRQAGELERTATSLHSKVRFSTLDSQLFVHSAFPTEQGDAVFFGPDTYRFARLIRQAATNMPSRSPFHILDVGAGSGAGGLHAATLYSRAHPTVTLTDINARALRFSRINAVLNGVADVHLLKSDLFANVTGLFDLIIANPPYLVDPLTRIYRHGGGELGANLSLRIVEDGIDRLSRGGRLILYTGSAIIDGKDRLYDTLRRRLGARRVRFEYEEIDPDVFGEELEHAPYHRADRIAVVGITIYAG